MISNERLEELIEFWSGQMEFDQEHTSKSVQWTADVLSSLTELKSIRQAATAGVEEAAERLYDAVAQVSIGGSYNVPHRLALPVIREHLAALLAERDAVLRECREYVQDAVDEQSRGCELLTKIDALTKGGGE